MELLDRGIMARLDRKFVIGSDGQKDRVVSIENVVGTQLRDVMVGDNTDNTFRGLGGNDLLIGGRGARDEANYRGDANYGGTDGIIANLTTGRIVDGFGTVDTVRGIEAVRGTDQNDEMQDSRGADWFRPEAGEDIVRLSRGDDRVRLGFDGDADLVVLQGTNFGDEVIWGFDLGTDKLDIENAVSFGEISQEADGDDTVISWAGNTITLCRTGGALLDADDFGFV